MGKGASQRFGQCSLDLTDCVVTVFRDPDAVRALHDKGPSWCGLQHSFDLCLKPMQIGRMRDVEYFAINLRRSEDRWAAIASAARQHNIDLKRIDAVEGRDYDIDQWDGFDVDKFEKCNGRAPIPGEFGCYLSHVRALRAFLEGSADSAVILEDDAVLNENLVPFAQHLALQFGNGNYLVRLTSHRQPMFEELLESPTGVSIGQCWFGPTGSSAAYWLPRPAAERLLSTLLPGYLSVDTMLERSWETGVTALLVKPNLLSIPSPQNSVLVSEIGYDAGKFPWFRRIGAFVFRMQQLRSRLFFCLRTRSVHSGQKGRDQRDEQLYDVEGL